MHHTRYIPPHPQRGSPYHRYCLLLLPHADPSAKIDAPVVSDAERRGFDLRAFCATHGIDGENGGGAHMWREEWDPTVSDIYKHTLSAWSFFALTNRMKSFLHSLPFPLSIRAQFVWLDSLAPTAMGPFAPPFLLPILFYVRFSRARALTVSHPWSHRAPRATVWPPPEAGPVRRREGP